MSRQDKYPKHELLGVEVDALTIPQAIGYIAKMAGEKGSPASYVVKPYVEFLDRAANDKELQDILNNAELCLADGIALHWGTHYLYGGRRNIWRLLATLAMIPFRPAAIRSQLPEVFGGIKFTWPLLKEAQQLGLSVFLVGSPAKQTIADTAAYIKKQLPGLKIAGHFTGRLNDQLEAQLVTSLKNADPDLILVGMGFPKQEQLMARLQNSLSHGVMVGEGGTFDYVQFGGRLPKAPMIAQRLGLEWLWRLILQPSRFKRQLAIPGFIIKIYQAGKKLPK